MNSRRVILFKSLGVQTREMEFIVDKRILCSQVVDN